MVKRAWAIAACFSVSTQLLAATNLVVNGEFDSTVLGWNSFYVTASWDSRDASGSSESGSLRNDAPAEADETSGYVSHQCLTLPAGARTISFGGKVMIPSGQTRLPWAGIAVRFVSTEDCLFGNSLGEAVAGSISAAEDPLDVWSSLDGSADVPDGATRIGFFLTFSGGGGSGPSHALYDQAYLFANRSTGDFNGDGNPDLLWRNYSTGAVNVWFLDGTTYIGGASLFTVADPQWRIEGTGDFNGDGKTDLIWRNYTTGAVNAWFLDGTAYIGGASLFTVPDPNWEIEVVGDFNGDGKDDLIWRNDATGEVNAWFLDGTAYLGGASLFTVADTNWKIEVAGDFNGDGKTDLIWRNYATGAVNVWFLNGASYIGGASLFTVPDANWNIEAVGDYSGDRKLDLIWRNYATGAVNVWFLNGTTYSGGASLFTVAGTSWEIAGPR